jgi:polyphosphate kinase
MSAFRSTTGSSATPLRRLVQADPAIRLFDADSGFLAFQYRVLEEACDARHPLLERVKFLAIVSTNLEEFMARGAVSGRALAASRQLAQVADEYLCGDLVPMLAEAGIELPRRMDLAALWSIASLNRADLRDQPLTPRVPAELQTADLFAAIRSGDVLLHHPYDSFDPVVDLLRQAAHDARVERVAITLYRTDAESPVGRALLEAAARGVAVDAVIEPNARRDEANNAAWAATLRQYGARVIPGVPGLKVHGKLALVVRREDGGRRRYVHLSSGNYHSGTARAYTDLALLTCDRALGADVESLFEYLCGRVNTPQTTRLIVAPFSLRASLCALIEREAAWARYGAPAHLILKVNALTDPDVIRALYEASRQGVSVDLIVRGPCRLRPGVPGLSDSTKVRSIVGRFLEHSRAWWFRNGGDEEVYVGSSDVMPRNFSRRVEVVAPVTSDVLKRRIRDEVLGVYLADNVQARMLLHDGAYVRDRPSAGAPVIDSQSFFLQRRGGPQS